MATYTFAVVTFWANTAAVGIAVALAGILLRPKAVSLPRSFLLFLTFVLWTVLTSLASPHSNTAALVELMKVMVVFFVATQALDSPPRLRMFLWFTLACYILFPIRGVFVGGDSTFGRVVWNYVYSNPNDLAAISLLALGIALALAFSPLPMERPKWVFRVASAASATAILTVILLTQSRAALIGLVAGYATAFIPTSRRRLRQVVPALIALLVVALSLPPTTWERFAGIAKVTRAETIAHADPEGSAAQRFAIQQAGIRMVVDHWALGVGLNAFPKVIGAYDPSLARRDAHNTYLAIAAETGLPGLALWLLMIASILSAARRTRIAYKESNVALQQSWIERGLVSYLVAAFFGSYGTVNVSYIALAILVSSTRVLASEANRSREVKRNAVGR